ncbi:T9SS type A sorting domain-containing protein [Flavobacterium sp. LHD-85]|uniref:T9SS type A sorting domain-containing protein n=1 Tax=Flavobacterium sp. LHD-85 TaxID=3071410 RepID=UPI0027E20C30|nr:T9SS type A sorting domain-containing protein [Flavobacterium sp. LHD-85]MDQ6528092.1 T9SS type A sorting domain-containing protein [Flavobacterium sp. LHD-85]
MQRIIKVLILSLIFSIYPAYSQSPGGVLGAQVWFKTSRLANGYFNWQDFGGNGSKLNHWNTKNEVSNVNFRYYNFNPSLYFDGTSRQFFLDQTNLQQGTIVGLFGHATTYYNNENILYGITGRTNEGVLITNDKVVNSTERDGEVLDYGSLYGEDLYRNPDNSEGIDAKFRETSLKIVSYYQYQQPNISVWGEDPTSNLTLGYGYINNVNGLSTYSLKSFSNNFYGYIPELFVYSRVLTPLERRKAETYLAIKYGVTLNNSYISSDDRLIWDWSTNKTYNNRITGIMRDDASGLDQPFSTTSYEEGPYFSNAYDSNTYPATWGNAGALRLLIMGQFPGCDLTNTNTAVWGDDNGALTTQNTGGIAGIKRMSRTWKLVTNMHPPTEQEKTLLFNNNGQEVNSEFGKTTFTNKINTTTGNSVTQTSLQGKNGYMEFKNFPTGSATIIKFGAKDGTASSLDYGIRIDQSGYVYAIENTKPQVNLYGYAVPASYKITIEKLENSVFINIYDTAGNKLITTKTLTILPADVDKSFYGIVSLENKKTDVSLTVAHGGFAASGSRVELSYETSKAAEFASYTDKSFLIIDRSGKGDFAIENVEYYPVSEIITSRKKLVFNNVVWDADGNGTDVFSFGYKNATVKLIALEEGINPTCADGVLQQNGKINVEIKEGLPGYKYTLTKTGTTPVLQTGTFYDSKMTLTNLEAADYDLTLEMIGTNFEKTAVTQATTATTTAMLAGGKGSLEWAVTDFTSDKYIGFINQRTSLTTALMNYGVLIKQNQLFFWNKGVASETALATLSKGSKIKLEMDGGILQCTVDGQLVGTKNLAAADITLAYYGFVSLLGTPNGIYNLVHTGFVSGTTKLAWQAASYLSIVEGDGVANKVVQKIKLEAPECQEILPPDTPLVTDNLVVAPVPSKAGANFNINVKLNNPSEATVLIFNTSGILITQLRSSELQKEITFTTSIPVNGIYIIKVLTTEGEFSKSIIIN